MQIIKQVEAANLRKVSRQRIWELIKRGKLQTAKDENGKKLRGKVYLEEVMALEKGKGGRPKLTSEELLKRNPNLKYKVDEKVYFIDNKNKVPAIIKKIGKKRINVQVGDEQFWTIPQAIVK
jgi:hypothetical protein